MNFQSEIEPVVRASNDAGSTFGPIIKLNGTSRIAAAK